MKLDFTLLTPILSAILRSLGSGANVGDILKSLLRNNPEAIASLIPLLIDAVQDMAAREEQKVEPVPVPVPAPLAPPQVADGIAYASLKAKILFFERAGRVGLYGKTDYDAIVSGAKVQLFGDFAHLDCTPFDAAGQEIGPGDPRHLGFDANGYPLIRYRWWIDGVQQHDTNDDHFNLSSIFRNDQDHGLTPTLKLIKLWGPGKGHAEFEFYVPKELNNGVEITSNRLSWYVD